MKPLEQEPFEAFAGSWLMPTEERTEISWPTRQAPESMLTRLGELRAHEGPSASGGDDMRTWGPRGNSSSGAAADPDAGPKVAFAPIGTAHTALNGSANLAPSGSLGFFMSGVAAKPITESVGITISNAHRHLMLLESKYSTEPRSVGPSAAAKARGPSRYVLDNLKKARDAGRIPEDVIDDALAKYTNGDYSACFVGTGNAHNGYIIHYRNHTPVILKRFER